MFHCKQEASNCKQKTHPLKNILKTVLFRKNRMFYASRLGQLLYTHSYIVFGTVLIFSPTLRFSSFFGMKVWGAIIILGVKGVLELVAWV